MSDEELLDPLDMDEACETIKTLENDIKRLQQANDQLKQALNAIVSTCADTLRRVE